MDDQTPVQVMIWLHPETYLRFQTLANVHQVPLHMIIERTLDEVAIEQLGGDDEWMRP